MVLNCIASASGAETPKPTRGHNFKLYKNHSSATVRAKFFSKRIVNVWNNLPDGVDFSTLASFIRTVKTLDFSKYIRYS